MAKLIYMDVCALSRPFDDQGFLRVRLETEAVNLILSKIREKIFKLLVSPAHNVEIRAIDDVVERIKLQTILDEIGERPTGDVAKIRTRAEDLVRLGFGIADAAHVAFAEVEGAEFITCDDRLIKKCMKREIGVWCGGPLTFCDKEGLR